MKGDGPEPVTFRPEGQHKEKVLGLSTIQHPVETVNWSEAAEFCELLSQQEQLDSCYARSGGTFSLRQGDRIPPAAEAEWEESRLRAGWKTTRYCDGDDEEGLKRAAWFLGNSESRTHAVASLQANPFGLMVHGNIWEWVQDWWDGDSYEPFRDQPALDPAGPTSAGARNASSGEVVGSDNASFARASTRGRQQPVHTLLRPLAFASRSPSTPCGSTLATTPPAIIRPADGAVEVLPIIDLKHDVPARRGVLGTDGAVAPQPATGLRPRGDPG